MVCGQLVHFFVFGIMYQEKSGNPASSEVEIVFMTSDLISTGHCTDTKVVFSILQIQLYKKELDALMNISLQKAKF
jgi:hypothetical protein